LLALYKSELRLSSDKTLDISIFKSELE